MDKKTSLYIYKDINEFLMQMEYLSNEYSAIDYYYKYIKDIVSLRDQLTYLEKANILCAFGFLKENTFKLTIKDKNNKYCIEYKFKHRYDYLQFRHEMNKLEK